MAYHHGNLKQALLERAAEVIAERGLEGLSLRGLARDLGVSHGAPRAHFADRGALVAELAKEGFRRAIETMEAGAEAAGPDPIAKYRALGRSYVRFACEEPAFFQALQHPDVRRSRDGDLDAAHAAWTETVRRGARAAQAAGWHPEADLDALVALSLAGATGAAQLAVNQRLGPTWEIGDFETTMDAMFDLLIHRGRISAPARHVTPPTHRRRRPRTRSAGGDSNG